MSDDNMDSEPATPLKRACGLIVDFDFALIDGVAALDKACVKALGAGGAKTDATTFPRRLFGQRIHAVLHALLPGEGKAEAAAAAIAADMDQAAAKAPVNETVLAICKRALDENVHLAFVTMRTPGVVEARIAALGLDGAVVIKSERCERFGEHPADVWSRSARTLKLNARFCTAIAASAAAVRQAVMAGMRTAAFTNPLIGFQDFAGVDFAAEGVPGSEAVEAVMALVNARL